MLDLDPEEILARYAAENRLDKRQRKQPPAQPPSSSHDVGSLAEKPSILPLSYLGLGLLILLTLGALICWYFSWNPATYLGEQLRALENTPAAVEYGDLEPAGIAVSPANPADSDNHSETLKSP